MIVDIQIKTRYIAYLGEINAFQKKVSALWQKRITEKFSNFFIDNKDSDSENNEALIKKYIALEGGYKIPENEWGHMNPQLVDFFHNINQHYNGYVYLRGYDYYASDKSMHLSISNLSNAQSFAKLSARFKRYRSYVSVVQMLYDEKLTWIDYLGIQSYFEWIWNDIAILSWILIYFNENALIKKFNPIIDQMAGIVVESIYGFFDQKINCASDLHLKLDAILNSSMLNDVMHYVHGQLHCEQYIFRALREGDQLWLVLASYEFKLLPWLQKNTYKSITLIGNAFGAINSAFLLKNCLAYNSFNVFAENIFYSVHEQEMHRNTANHTFCGLDIGSNNNECAIVVDDSLFTGKTFRIISRKLERHFHHVYFLPLTFDVATIFNHPEEMLVESTMEDSINYVEGLIREIGDNLSPARSYWAFKKRKPNCTTGIAAEYSAKVRGSDLLIRILWRRFKEEILG